MFPEYRELISRLKVEDAHFKNLFDKHNELDQVIQNMEQGIVPAASERIESMKKEKLQLKDQLFAILTQSA